MENDVVPLMFFCAAVLRAYLVIAITGVALALLFFGPSGAKQVAALLFLGPIRWTVRTSWNAFTNTLQWALSTARKK